jgi:hypothetical protein
MKFKTIIAGDGQTLEDVALQHYGCYEGVFLLTEDNGLGIDDLLAPGQELLIREPAPTLNDFNKLVIDAELVPNSDVPGQASDNNYVEDDYVDEDYI